MMYPRGEYSAFREWEISHNFITNLFRPYDEPCEHAVNVDVDKDEVKVPQVVIAYNEGGYNCTILCVQCLISALKQEGLLP